MKKKNNFIALAHDTIVVFLMLLTQAQLSGLSSNYISFSVEKNYNLSIRL